jgi:hypothetical protein
VTGDRIFLAIFGLGMAVYFGGLVRGGLKDGMLEPPGAGAPLSRERWPKTFRFSIVLCWVVVALGIAICLMAVTGWQPLND